MEALRVLVVLTSAQRRGAEVEGSQLAAELQLLGLRADVVALAGGSAGSGAAAHLDVRTLGERPLSLATVRAVRGEARGVDVVVAFGSSALPACALALVGMRTPFVYRSIGDPSRWVRGAWHRRRTALLFRRAARVVALWPSAAASIASLYGVSPSLISCIPNARHASGVGDGETATRRAEARQAHAIPEDATAVAWVGALSAEKRPLLAIEAVAATPAAWLLIAGEGPLTGEVAAAAERLLPTRHLLLGTLDDLSPVWAAADVVLLTSATEGMPGVLLEAALHGLPAVATRVGAVAEVVADGTTGRLVDADADAGQVAAALADAVAQGVRWGATARSHALDRFTWAVVAPRWAELLAEVSGERGSRSR